MFRAVLLRSVSARAFLSAVSIVSLSTGALAQSGGAPSAQPSLPPVVVSPPKPRPAVRPVPRREVAERPVARPRPARAASVRAARPVVAPRPQAAPAPVGAPADGRVPVQQTTAGPVRGYEAITSVSATKTNLPIFATPISVQVVTRKLIEDQGAVTQSEALRNVSGFQPLNTANFGQQGPTLRGFSAERVVDGLPNYYDAGARDLLVNVERIEVIKGPQGVLFSGGTNAVSGTINVVSKLPTITRFAEFGVTAGTPGYVSPWFDINQPLTDNGTVLFRVTGQWEHAPASNIEIVKRRAFTINPTLTITNNNGTSLTLQGHYSRRDQKEYAGLPTVGTIDTSLFSIRRNLFPSDPNIPQTTSNIASFTAKLDHAFNDTWSTSTIARFSRSNFNEPSMGLISNAPAFGSSFEVYNFSIIEQMREFSLNSSVTGKFDNGWIKNTLLLSLDYNKVNEKGAMYGDACSALFAFFFGCTQDTQIVDFTNPFFGPYHSQSFPYILADNSYSTKGATAQLTTSLFDRLHILLGGRYQQLVDREWDGTGARTAATGSPWADTKAQRFLPRAGASLEVFKWLSVFGGYSEGMKPIAFYNGVDPMKPQLSRQGEVGVKLQTEFGLSGTLAFFRIDKTNVATTDPTTFRTYQTGLQRSSGFEADLIWQPNENWSFLASYANINAYVVDDKNIQFLGVTPVGVPRNSGRLWGNYLVTEGGLKGLSLGAGMYAASKQRVQLGQPWLTPSYVTLDAKIGYQIDNWKFQVVGKNLADHKYWTPYQYFAARVAPGERRSVLASASTKF